MKYAEFIRDKSQRHSDAGFYPVFMPDSLYPFQSKLVEWALRKGRAALFEDCGLGKTLQQLVWAENVHRHTGRRVLILTPLSVGVQTCLEGQKFGIWAERTKDASLPDAPIVVINYEKLHLLDSSDFVGCVCDESSILKNADGVTKTMVTKFMRHMDYRLLCTATAAPNDYIELGTSSESLGYLGYVDMLKMFFKNDNNTNAKAGRTHNMMGGKFRFRGHAETEFWRWVCSWARAIRKPSDIGFDDGPFNLPNLIERQHTVNAKVLADGYLLPIPAVGLREQRDERTRTVQERCEAAARIATEASGPVVCWTNLNRESEITNRLVSGSIELTGSQSDDEKEEILTGFVNGGFRVLVTKPSICGFGMNWQHCNRQTFFPSHSFEQYYQCVRRSLRFGQTKDVEVDIIATEGDADVLSNMQRKARAAENMFQRLVSLMHHHSVDVKNEYNPQQRINLPSWL
jgi:hypothetical protein